MEQARQNLEAQVLERAGKAPQFREELKDDPRGTVSREFGAEVPSDITIEVVGVSSTTVYLVLPLTPAQWGQELSEQELQAVAGGGWTDTQILAPSCVRQLCPV